MDAIGNRLYGTAIPLPDEEVENVPVPYIIVTFDGLSNDVSTKDDGYEGDYDTVNIGISVTGTTLNELHTLTRAVRQAVRSYITQNDTGIDGYQFGAQQIMYDQYKPCYGQVLTYACNAFRDPAEE